MSLRSSGLRSWLTALAAENSDHHFPHHPSAIHLIFKIDHGRSREMPGQAGARGAAAYQCIGKDGMKVVDGVGLRRRRIRPTEPELAHALFHDADDITDFL